MCENVPEGHMKLRRNLIQGEKTQPSVFLKKRGGTCIPWNNLRKKGSEIRSLWRDNCSFFFAWHSTGSLALGCSRQAGGTRSSREPQLRNAERADDNDVSLPAVSLCEDTGLLFLYLTGGLTVGVPVCKPISSTAGEPHREPHREPPCSLHSWKAMQGTVIRWLMSSLTNERYCQADWCLERANKISSICPLLSCYSKFWLTYKKFNTGWRCWSDQKEAGAATNYGKKLAGIHCNPLKYN